MNTFRKTALLVLLAGLGSMATSAYFVPVHAQTPQQSYTVLAPLPCIPSAPNPDVPGDTGVTCPGNTTQNQDSVDFKTYIQNAFNLLIAVSAVAAVFMIVWGGIEYMTTASFTSKKASLDRVTHAIYGLILILASYLILRTIDPRFVAIPTTLVPKLQLKSAPSTYAYLQDLQNQASQNDQNYQSAMKNIGAVKSQITAVENQRTTLANNILKAAGVPTSDNPVDSANKQCLQLDSESNPDLAAMCAQLANLTNNISTLNNTITLQTAKGLLTGAILQPCSPTGDPKLCDITAAQQIYTTYSTKVAPDQLPQLQAAVSYAQTYIRMNQAAALLYQASSKYDLTQGVFGTKKVSDPNSPYYKMYTDTVNSVNDLANKYTSKNQNGGDLIQQMKTQQQTLIQLLNNMTYNK